MFFYVDESGNTGSNLFDKHQPVLYYGVLSSPRNLDTSAREVIEEARKISGVQRLHASRMGVVGLSKISRHLVFLQQELNLSFDIYRVMKADHAIISFFDQVFDQGMNPAMSWAGYWTPLRYGLLIQLASLFDEDLAQDAWLARIETKDKKAYPQLVKVCQQLIERLPAMTDWRAKQLIGDTLRWAAKNPSKLSYNCKSKKGVLDITPNIIGFQVVMRGIASRIETPQTAQSIIVDQQCQFNRPQRILAEFYAKARNVDWSTGPGLPVMDLSNIPTEPLTFKAGTESVGLELVDCYLWIFKRIFEGKTVPPELYPLIQAQLNEGNTSELSLNSIAQQYSELLRNLPPASEAGMQRGMEIRREDEKRRMEAVQEP
ncbi:MAG: DUF3800 domain-containing protein [Cyanobacteria bacterium J06621_11]